MFGGLSEKVLSVVYDVKAVGTSEAAAQVEAMDAKIQASAARTAEVQAAFNRQTASQLRSLTPTELAMAQSQGMNVSMPGAAVAKTAEGTAASEVAGMGTRDVLKQVPGAGGALGMLGMGGFTAGGAMAMGGLALAAGAVEAGKSLIDTYESEQAALRDLGNAYQDAGVPLSKYQGQIDQWLESNKQFIPDLNEAREGFANLTTAGINQNNIMLAMNDALDLSAKYHISLTEAVQRVILAEEGQGRSLKVLGINVKDYGDLTMSATQIIQKEETAKKSVTTATEELSKAQRALTEDEVKLSEKKKVSATDLMHEQDLKQKVQDATNKLKDAQSNYTAVLTAANDKGKEQKDLLDAIAGKAGGARGNISDLAKAHNELKASWEKLANDTAPALEAALTGVLDVLDGIVNAVAWLFQSHSAGGAPGVSPVIGGRFGGIRSNLQRRGQLGNAGP